MFRTLFRQMWYPPKLSFAERRKRAGELIGNTLASAIPQRVRYYVVIQELVRAVRPDEVVPEVTLSDILSRINNGKKR